VVRGLVHAGAYLPRFSDGRRRVGAADEDAFTFAATALERAYRPPSPAGGPATVTIVGPLAGPDPSAFAGILGEPVSVAPPPDAGSDPLGSSLRTALAGTGRRWVVVVASDRRDGRGGADGPPGEGAAALLVDDRPEAIALPSSSLAGEGSQGGGVRPLAHLFDMARGSRDPSVWTGDWSADPARGPPAGPAPPRDAPAPLTVSQGAFVPVPRDEEARPGRWRFVAERCSTCGTRTFPGRGRCSRCGEASALRPEPLPLDGATVLAATWIGPGGQPTEFDGQVEASGPYGVVLAEVAPGARVTLMVADARPEQVRVGARVDTLLRRLYPIEGAWRYGRKAVPARRDRTDGGR